MLEQIKASAGSGKTYTLTRRFLLLLSEMSRQPEDYDICPACRPPGPAVAAVPSIRRGLFSEILAMTFTNKAAAEMKSRIIESLKKCALGLEPEETSIFAAPEAHVWLNVILRRYDALNIRTIDSLLAMLTRISAGKLGIPPDFEISFDDAAYLDPLYDELLDKAAEGAAKGDAEIVGLLEKSAFSLSVSRQSRGFTVRDLRAHILGALQTMQEQSEAGSSSATGLPADLPCADEGALYAHLGDAAAKLNQNAEIMAAMLEKYSLAPLENFRAVLESYQTYAPGGELPNYSRYLDKRGLEECLRKKDRDAVTEPLQAAFSGFLAVVKHERGRVQFYKSALKILPVTKLACLLLPGLNKLRSASGTLTGSMLPALAREALGGDDGVSEACCRLGSRLTHLLIDEFQDTSRAQWQAIEPLALECLSRGGSLRYVGDVKQAIYSWRGGDSSLFDEIAHLPELRAVNPHPRLTALQFNWRSAPQLVEFNNRFFSRLEEPGFARSLADILLPKAPPAVQERAAGTLARTFSGTNQAMPEQRAVQAVQAASGTAQGFVGIQKVEGERLEDFKKNLKLKFKVLLEDSLLPRRCPGEIAVLVRSGKEAEDVTAWLGELGVGAVTEHSFKLADNPLIQRLVSFLRFIDYPADDLNFWNFISGPECFSRVAGLGTAELETWLAGLRLEQLQGTASGGPLYGFFRRDFPELWDSLLAPFYGQSGLMSAYDLMSELYNRYRLTALLPGQDLYLRCFLELLYNAGRQGQASPAAFLDFWEEKGNGEKIPRPETPNSVNIMTLHKAKGLEFPVVVIPFHRFSESNARELTMCRFEGQTWLVEENESLGEAFFAAQSSAALEKLHLLYVGWTRAAEEMHLFVGGSELDLRRGMPRALELLLNDYEFDEDGYYSAGSLAPAAPSSSRLPDPTDLKDSPASAPPALSALPLLLDAATASNSSASGRSLELPADWRPMDWLPRLKIFRNPVPEAVYDERARGTLFHNCLENLSSLEASPENIAQAVERALHGFPLPLDNLDQARQEAVRALQWFCALPEAPRWLREGRREQSILDENGQLHRMDMLVKDGENLLVLEYKTGRSSPEHLEQIRRYLELLDRGSGAASPGRLGKQTPRGLLIYLDERRTQEVRLEPATPEASR
ncbi:MAG: UvrD-helicase domain-containing protein [Deltaproteobacteria bacterium]|nr:UvrD-helicase domain-containing protein [Deltaproteobacteria bacterium]